jgi:hypothetical protein
MITIAGPCVWRSITNPYKEERMKRLILMIAVATLVASTAFWAAAHGDKSGGKSEKGPKVYCCHGKGDCDKLHTKAECEKEGGKVVDHCKECK